MVPITEREIFPSFHCFPCPIKRSHVTIGYSVRLFFKETIQMHQIPERGTVTVIVEQSQAGSSGSEYRREPDLHSIRSYALQPLTLSTQ